MLLNYLKILLSVLLTLGLVGCPDDEDEDADLKLVIDDIKDFAEGGSPANFKVLIQEEKKTVEEGDNAKLKVKVSIKCGDKAVEKEATAAKGVANFTGTDFKHDDWKKDDKCTATATAEGAEKATDEFTVGEASAVEEPPADEVTAVAAKGKLTITNADDAHKIMFANKGNNACGGWLVSWNNSNAVSVLPSTGDGTGLGTVKANLYVAGDITNCELKVNDEVVDITGHTPADQVTPSMKSGGGAVLITEVQGKSITVSATSKIYVYVQNSDGTDSGKGEATAWNTKSTPLEVTVADTAASDIIWVRHSEGIQRVLAE